MKKRVLHLLASNSYSGAENVVCTIIENCSDEFEMYYCSPDGPIKEVLKKRHINYIMLKKMSLIKLKKIIKDYNIDIVHAHDYKASFVSIFLGIKVISHLHCDYRLLSISFFVGFIYSLIQKKFSKIIMISKEILDNASFKDNVYDKTVIINNVVDKDKIIRMSNEFNTCKYDLIFVGRLNDIKKPLLFIDIVNDLCRNNFNIKACIIGDGDLYLSCKNKIKNENLESNIDLLGFQTNPFPYVKNSKVLVMPSGYEGLGLVAIESMVLGTIVVNSGVGGLRTIFNNHSKYICNNKEDYVKCIVKLLKNDNCVYKKDCNEMAKKFTDLDQYKNKIINLYKEIIK